MNLAELQETAIRRGYGHHFTCTKQGIQATENGPVYDVDDLRIVHSSSVDTGTDPGDDATLYMLEARDGTRGMIIIPASFYTDPHKASMIDALRKKSR